MTRILSLLPSLISFSLYFLIGIENLPPVWPITFTLKILAILLLLFGAAALSNGLALIGTVLTVTFGIMSGKFLSVCIALFFFLLHVLMSGLSRKG